METLDDVIYQRNLLIDTICDMAEKAGIKDSSIPADGPMALLLADDLVRYNAALLDQIKRQSARLKQLGATEEHF